MESKRTYDESYEELKLINKSIFDDRLTIDFTKLDGRSAGIIRTKLSHCLSKRLNEMVAEVSGVR